MPAHPGRAFKTKQRGYHVRQFNKATVIGYLGKDPEIHSFQNGGRATNFSITTSESCKDKDSGKRGRANGTVSPFSVTAS